MARNYNFSDLLKKEIQQLNINNLPVSDYSKRYFNDYLKKLDFALKSCNFLIEKSLSLANLKPENAVFVDHGGGIGILSILAKKAGLKTVIYNDIHGVACKDAEILANALGIRVDHFVSGDISVLKDFSEKQNLKVDIICSRNVIEHIHDLNDFLKTVAEFQNPNLSLLFATTANEKNFLVDQYTKKIHREIENTGMRVKGGKDQETIKPYKLLRQEIITSNFPEIPIKEIEELVKRTRGMIKEQIVNAVERYLKENQLPPLPSHPTNTCDPYNGNWAEHLVSIKKYEELFKKYGFTFKFYNGFYNTKYKQKVLNLVTPILNSAIKLLGKKGIYLAPYIVLAGKRKRISI